MARGRKTTWNFDRIAGDYNLWYGNGERKVDASEARAIILENQTLFRRLVRHKQPQVALFYLKLVLGGRMTEKEVVDRRGSCPADVPLLKTFRPHRGYEPRLPPWFLQVVRAWLDMRVRVEKNPPPVSALVGADHSESISLSYYLMADCLFDERFIWVMTRVKAIWRMDEFEAKTWFRWLHGQQEAVIHHLFPAGVPQEDELLPYQAFGHGGGWTNPLDDRNVHGKLAHGPYGLPLSDYKSHLRQLVRLAGGDPAEEYWQDWVETLLWSLARREIVFQYPEDGAWQTSWLRGEYLANAWCAKGRDIPHAPPTEPYENTEWTSEGEVRLRVAVPSRWVSLSSFSELRDDVLSAIVNLWGAYRALPSHSERLRYLQSFTARAQAVDEEIGPLYETWEDEIERAGPGDQQTGPEAQRIGGEQTKVELRVREKHRKRSERARNRLQS